MTRHALPGAPDGGARSHSAAHSDRSVLVWLKRLVEALADLVLPTPCAGCERVDTRWCSRCRAWFGRVQVRSIAGLPPVVVLAPYAGAARHTVLAYKERGRRDLATGLAECIVTALRSVLPALDLPTPNPTRPGRPPWVLVPAPSRPAAARARGGDHVLRLAQAVAARWGPGGLGTPGVTRALALGAGARDSVGLDPTQRAANLARHLRPRPRALPPPGTPVVLLDDVLTTGATARAATAALRDAGCPVVAIVVLTAAHRRTSRTRTSQHRSRGPPPSQETAPWPHDSPVRPITVWPCGPFGLSSGRENRPLEPSPTRE